MSVVTNALRLRGFRRPTSAAAILHPSLRERLSEYAYLASIALVALTIGLAALYLARTDLAATSSGAAEQAQQTPTTSMAQH